MSENVIIRVEGLGKKYSLRHLRDQRYIALRDVLVEKATGLFRRNGKSRGQTSDVSGQTKEDFWALRGINFEVKQGEVIGIIGRNGAGKSTLLKILSRITEPTEGRLRIHGRVASLLEVGTGFHPELTGRENIYLNGAILGMHRAEINRKFDEIVAFAETENFLDTPVKRYSSGMYVRLAFAVAAHLEPEILVIDEVLAVGDAGFQKKCLGKMSEVAHGGRTVLFVSHNMAAVQRLCGKAIHLEQGRVLTIGEVEQVTREYLSSFQSATGSGMDISLGQGFTLHSFDIQPKPVVSGQPLHFEAEISSKRVQRLKELALLFFSDYGTRIAIIDARQFGVREVAVSVEKLLVRGRIRNFPFIEGDYRIGLHLATDDYRGDFPDVASFSVTTQSSSADTVTYAPAHRGFIELDVETTEVHRGFKHDDVSPKN